MTDYQKASIPDDIRWAIWERDDFTCHYCGRRRFLSVDHIIPESKGGTGDAFNLVTACVSCNSRKATASYDEALSRLVDEGRTRRVFWSPDDYQAAVGRLAGQRDDFHVQADLLRWECEWRYGQRIFVWPLTDLQSEAAD